MSATDELKTEHRAIERMLAVLEVATQRLDEGQRVRPGLFREAVEFVRSFADRCHHGKEEQNLFPRMEERGVPRAGGPLGVMLFEHEQGREYIAAIGGAIEDYDRGVSSAVRIIADNARGYIGLLRDHIMKEEEVLFPLADSVLSQDDQQELERRFQQIETEVMGSGVRERHHRLLDDLERELGLASG